MRQSRFWAVAALGACLSGCVTTQEIPLAPNTVRLDIYAPFAGDAANEIMPLAAELTLQNGYDYFRLTPIYWTNGDFAYDVGVTVVMLHAGEAGAYGAFDARAVLGHRRP